MKHQKSTSFVAGRSGRADRGTFVGTVRLLLPYLWPADRADLRIRVALAVVLALALGFAGAWRALGVKAAPYLRNE